MAVQHHDLTHEPHGFVARAVDWVNDRIAEFHEHQARRARYEELASLDDKTLRDIGVARSELLAVAKDPAAFERQRH